MKYFLIFCLSIFIIDVVHAKTSILFLGDSLSEGQGVDANQAFPHLIENILKKNHFDVIVTNGGVSGSTSISGISRLKWHLKTKTDILVLELGANDGLRGLKISDTEKNLKQIIQLAKEHNIKILLLGILMPPNYGKKYTQEFETMYKYLSTSQNIPLFPFLLKGVAGIPQLNLPDGVHPNSKGHEIIASNLAVFIEKYL
jgi:acyl-CoA thioesterase-1